MKRTAWVTAAVVIATLSASWPVRASTASDQKQIKDIEQKIMDATSTNQVMQYYDPDADIYDFHAPLQYKGETAIRGDLDSFFNNAKDVKGKFVEIHVVTDGKLAIAYSIQHFTWAGSDGKQMAGTFRVTDIYRKAAGQWKLIHSHVSVPVDPSNGKAAMDLPS